MKIKRITIILFLGCLISSCSSGKKDQLRISNGDYAVYHELPVNSVTPKGWLETILTNARNGTTGHLENAGNPYNQEAWTAPAITKDQGFQKWWSYEQTGYWVDGLIKLGYLLDDEFLLNKAKLNIDYVLSHPANDGYLGPEVSRDIRWPHTIFFRTLMADYAVTNNEDIINKLKAHFAQEYAYDNRDREWTNIEIVMWLYQNSDKDPKLLALAQSMYEKVVANFSSYYLPDKPMDKTIHGVTYNEIAKLGAIMYAHTGNKDQLNLSVAAYNRLEKYHVLPEGVNVSMEAIHKVTPTMAHETCDISDYTWSLGYMLMSTGATSYADKIEQAMFNAAPGAITKDFKELQYFSSPNQIVSTYNSCHFWEGSRMAYSTNPDPGTDCCAGNVNRMYPNFVARLWMRDNNNGLVAAMYSPSDIKYNYKGRNIEVNQITEYPFTEDVKFVFNSDKKVKLPFTFRIPEWCKNPKVSLNGENIELTNINKGYVTITIPTCKSDELLVSLPQPIKIGEYKDLGAATISKGPLLYALKIKENAKKSKFVYFSNAKFEIHEINDENYPNFVTWNIEPGSDWNYALVGNKSDIEKSIKIRKVQAADNPWEKAPVELTVPAHLINNWKLQSTKVKSRVDGEMKDFVFTPYIPRRSMILNNYDKESELVTLVPYGTTRLRLTMFPWLDLNDESVDNVKKVTSKRDEVETNEFYQIEE